MAFAADLYAGPAPVVQRPPGAAGIPKPILQGRILAATAGMTDPQFSKTVILIVEHGAHGTIGLILNRPTKTTLSEFFEGAAGIGVRPDPIYHGGPVDKDEMYVLIRSAKRPDGSRRVLKDVYLSSSVKALRGAYEAGDKSRVYFGYAGWRPRQLEFEAINGGWRVLDAGPQDIFDIDVNDMWRVFSSQR